MSVPEQYESYRVELRPITVPSQYGTSYEAKVLGEATDAKSPKLTVEEYVDGYPSKLIERMSVFVKCPDAELDGNEQIQFIDDEFKNGTSINHAADRASDPSISKSHFAISLMVGRGRLDDLQRGVKDRPCLIYEYAEGDDLQRLKQKRDLQLDDVNADQFLDFSLSLARVVQVLHNQGIVHTFLVPRHIIWSPGGGEDVQKKELLKGIFTLVGFGYARHIDTTGKKSPFKVADEDKWFRAPECRESQSHAAFGYPADIYSIGAILYSLLLKEDKNTKDVKAEMDVLKTPPTDDRLLKERVARNVKNCQPKLLIENENILKLIDSCLRHDAEQRYSCVEELIEAIYIAKNATGKPSNVPQLIQSEFNSGEVSQLAAGEEIKFDYFKKLKRTLADELETRYRGLHRGHLEVYGHRDRIVTSLCRLLGSAGKGDTYRTMTLPDYWTDGNLGSLGRFLTMNKHMVRKGVKIERLFLVSHYFHELPEEMQVVLEDQLDAEKNLKEDEESGDVKGSLVLKVLKVPEETIADFERNGELVAYLEEYTEKDSNKTKEQAEAEKVERTICLNFFSTAQELWRNGEVSVRRTIKKVRFWNPNKVKRTKQFLVSKKEFEAKLSTAEQLQDFIFARGQPLSPEEIILSQLIGAGKNHQKASQ